MASATDDVRQFRDHVDAFDLVPAPRDAGGKVGLVLMVRE